MANWAVTGNALVRPDHIPIDIFLNEISFYRLNICTIREFLMIEGLLLEDDEDNDEDAGNVYIIKFYNTVPK